MKMAQLKAFRLYRHLADLEKCLKALCERVAVPDLGGVVNAVHALKYEQVGEIAQGSGFPVAGAYYQLRRDRDMLSGRTVEERDLVSEFSQALLSKDRKAVREAQEAYRERRYLKAVTKLALPQEDYALVSDGEMRGSELSHDPSTPWIWRWYLAVGDFRKAEVAQYELCEPERLAKVLSMKGADVAVVERTSLGPFHSNEARTDLGKLLSEGEFALELRRQTYTPVGGSTSVVTVLVGCWSGDSIAQAVPEADIYRVA